MNKGVSDRGNEGSSIYKERADKAAFLKRKQEEAKKAAEIEAKKRAEEEQDLDPWMLALKRKHKDLNDEELLIMYQKDMFEQEKAKKARKNELLNGLQKKKTRFRHMMSKRHNDDSLSSNSPTARMKFKK